MSEEDFLKLLHDSNELSSKNNLGLPIVNATFKQFHNQGITRMSLEVKKNHEIIFSGYEDREKGLEDGEVIKLYKKKLIKQFLMHIILKAKV